MRQSLTTDAVEQIVGREPRKRVSHEAFVNQTDATARPRQLRRSVATFNMKSLVALVLSLLVLVNFPQATSANRTNVGRKLRSGISGRVTDPNGAVVPGAKVTIVSRSSQAIVSLKSNTEGVYGVNLEPDTYDVTVEVWGFKKATRKSVKVAHKGRPHVDFVLELAPPVNAPRIIN